MATRTSSRRSVTYSMTGTGGGGGTRSYTAGSGGSGSYSAGGGGSSSYFSSSGGGGGGSGSSSFATESGGGSSSFKAGAGASYAVNSSATSFSGRGDASSRLSPTRMSRMEEKQELRGLNDRLAQYMDRVRQLEKENSVLSFQIKTQEETLTKERANIRGAYDVELADARRVLDETAKDRARLQIEAGKYRAQVDELLAKVANLERELKDADGRRLYAESQAQDLLAKCKTAENERKHFEDENMKLHREVGDLQKQLDAARKQLEEETLLRVDLENRLQSLREELAFEKQLHSQELNEALSKRQTEVIQVNTQFEDDYKRKLEDGLREMRENFDFQIRMSRKEFEEMYERKMAGMRDEADRKMDMASSVRNEVQTLKMQLESAMKDRDKFEGLVGDLEKRIRELEFELQGEKDSFYSRLSGREEEIRRLKQEIAEMMQEYQDLMDTKIQLDVEIEAYRKLLEVEESRLHLSPDGRTTVTTRTTSSSLSSGGTSGYGSRIVSSDVSGTGGAGGGLSFYRGSKRKRIGGDTTSSRAEVSYSGLSGSRDHGRFTYKTESHCEGAIEISDHDTEGAFVRIHNRSNEDVSIGGWQLKRIAGDDEVVYKFHRAFVLRAGKDATVWSSDAQVTHSPPDDLLMRSQQWPIGDTIRTVLVNANNEELSWRESTRTSSGIQRISYRTSGTGEYGLQSSTQSAGTAVATSATTEDSDQRCSIM